MSEKRPLRSLAEELTENIPSGPLGSVGEGDVIGTAGFLAVESAKSVFQFVPGIKTPGYGISSHSTRNVPNGEEHEFVITALSEDVAEFVSQYESSPSNLNYLTNDKEIVGFEEITTRRGYTTYKITVLLRDRGDVKLQDHEY
jgi:hypothetical protein